jgi:hypothetical protein
MRTINYRHCFISQVIAFAVTTAAPTVLLAEWTIPRGPGLGGAPQFEALVVTEAEEAVKEPILKTLPVRRGSKPVAARPGAPGSDMMIWGIFGFF